MELASARNEETYTLSISSKASSSSLFTLTVPSANRYSREERTSASLMETSPLTQSLLPYFLMVLPYMVTITFPIWNSPKYPFRPLGTTAGCA